MMRKDVAMSRVSELIGKIGSFGFAQKISSFPVFWTSEGWMSKASDRSYGWLLSEPKDRAVIYKWHLEKGEEVADHWHPCQETVLMLDGALRVDGAVEIGPGESVSFAPSARHSVKAIETCTFYVVFQPSIRILVEGEARND